MMKTFRITISDGDKKDNFCLQAKDKDEALRTARIAHTGTGWDVVKVTAKR